MNPVSEKFTKAQKVHKEAVTAIRKLTTQMKSMEAMSGHSPEEKRWYSELRVRRAAAAAAASRTRKIMVSEANKGNKSLEEEWKEATARAGASSDAQKTARDLTRRVYRKRAADAAAAAGIASKTRKVRFQGGRRRKTKRKRMRRKTRRRPGKRKRRRRRTRH